MIELFLEFELLIIMNMMIVIYKIANYKFNIASYHSHNQQQDIAKNNSISILIITQSFYLQQLNLAFIMNINIFQFLKQGTSLNRKSLNSNSALEKQIIYQKKQANKDYQKCGKFHHQDSDLQEETKTKKKNNNKEIIQKLKYKRQQQNKQFLSSKKIKINGLDCPQALSNFTKIINKYKIRNQIIKGLENLGHQRPTPVQCQVIPCILEKRNIIVTAPTGTGKTLSYLLPVLNNLVPGSKKITAIIMAPIQQLVSQIVEQLEILSEFLQGITYKCITKLSDKEIKRINDNKSPGFNILITTPLSFLTIFQNHESILKGVQHIVLDECDKYFQESFLEQIKLFMQMFQSNGSNAIYSLFSATIQYPVQDLLKNEILHDCIRIQVGGKNKVLGKIKQSIQYCTNQYGKTVFLKNMITQGGFVPPVLIFVQQKTRAKQLFYQMKKILKSTIGGKQKLQILTGDKNKEERQSILKNFDNGEYWALITTDLIARGVDFKNANLVINYDFPNSMLTYIHRVGRTGRAERNGTAVTLFTDQDKPIVRSLANLLQASGCPVPEWILSMPKAHKKVLKKLEKFPTKRLPIGHSTKKDSNWDKHLEKLQSQWVKLRQTQKKKMAAEKAMDEQEWQIASGGQGGQQVQNNDGWQIVGPQEDQN